MRSRLAVAALTAALAAVPASQAATPKLVGTVGPGYTISLKLGGKAVKTLKAGRYTLVVSDRSGFHNFRLKGPGVNVATAVSASGTRTFTVRLRPGRYTFQCDPHASMMRGSFRVA